jgi:peptidyl-prolyl cis-trans isomerase C
MTAVRRLSSLLLLLSAGLLLASCQGGESGKDSFQWKPLFGNGLHDSSPVIATVGDLKITQLDLDLRYDELPPKLKGNYQGEEGKRLLLKEMVDQALMVMGAVEMGLYNDTDVARTLISQRRSILDNAMRQYGLLRGNLPDEDDIRDYFDKNRQQFRQEGMAKARHVECLSKDEADLAYARLLQGGVDNDFNHVVKDYSRNIESAKNGGDVGWFNQGGVVPFVPSSIEFTRIAYDLKLGLHPPFRVADRWHVVEILRKEPGRPMTFGEARDMVLNSMLPGHQDRIIKDYLQDARQKHTVTFEGTFAPGRGISPETLFARGMALAEPQKKLDMFTLVFTDFPASDKADDALFMSAMVALDSWQDRRVAERYLNRLVNEYPDSELLEDAQFLRDNLYNPKALNPSSIEELRNK